MELALLIVILVLAVVAVVLLLLLLRGPQNTQNTELLAQLTGLEKLSNSATLQLKSDLASQRDELGRILARQQQTVGATLDQQRQTLERLRESLAESQFEGTTTLSETLTHQQRLVQDALSDMTDRLEHLSETLEGKMAAMQRSNEERLEQMRQTVDEKLHATLEARLGESFKQVSDRLEAVHQGLGEMRTLADGVGDLKKVMVNVKSRGTWGEVQLRALIEDILRPEEFVANFAPRRGPKAERVEFAVRLPGVESDQPIYLPVDAKFPVEDYQRLVDAQDAADVDAVRVHSRALEERIVGCARDIAEKYLEPGVTTDFALLFLPFEGLYAEVLRRPGLVERLQREHRIAVCGPTTLGALLNSLRMGFRAVALQKRSGDVGALLATVKAEFGAFAQVIDAVGGRLRQAQDEIEKVGVRTRAINRRLKAVEVLPGKVGPASPPADDDPADAVTTD